MNKKPKSSLSSQKGAIQLPILIGLLILAIALPVATRLVQQRQETREKAAYSQATAWFLPTNPGQKSVSDPFPVYLLANFGQEEMVGFNIKIEYPANLLALSNENVHIHSAFPETNKIRKEVDQTNGAIYLSYISLEGISSASEIGNPWVKLDFTVSSLGSGEIRLINNTNEYPQFQIVGVTAGPDSEIELKNQSGGEEIKVNYNLSPRPTTPPTSTPIPPTSTPIPPECVNNEDCDDSNLCTTDTCVDGSCEYALISCNEHAECNPSTGNCQCFSDNWGNCDNSWDNGCETNLTNEADCGACGNACSEDYVCLQRECADIGIYPACLIKNTSDELGIDVKYISTIEDNNAQWGEEDMCETGNIEGKKLVLQSVYPDSNNKCWQHEYHTAGSGDNLAIHCNHYRLCQEQEISCSQCPANGDFNGDGKVNEFDYGILIAHFGREGVPGEVVGDANCDGVVDEFDYGILIAHFGEGE